MLGSAVSSSTPNDFQPNSHIGVVARPVMNRHAAAGPPIGCPYDAVGMQRALQSSIGLPRRPTSALWMVSFLMPAEVSSNFIVPPRGCSRQHAPRSARVDWPPPAAMRLCRLRFLLAFEAAAQLHQPVAQLGSALELEVARGTEHLLFHVLREAQHLVWRQA